MLLNTESQLRKHDRSYVKAEGRGNYSPNTSITAAAKDPHEDVTIRNTLFKYTEINLVGIELNSKMKP